MLEDAVERCRSEDIRKPDRGGGRADMECHTVFFMEFADEIADIRAEDFLHRTPPDHMHFDIPRSK